MGERGQRPVFFPTDGVGPSWLNGILEIPGVMQVPGGVTCTWDVAWVVARLLRLSELPLPTTDGHLPGIPRYRELGLHERTWTSQKEDILFLARRAWAVLAEPMRSGKCLMSIGAAIAVDSRKTLIVCPKYARLGWADEIQEWTKEAAVLLCGRGAREVRVRCLTCKGVGEVNDTPCTDCRMRNGQSTGYRIYDVLALEPKTFQVETEHRRWPKPKLPGAPRINLLPLTPRRQKVEASVWPGVLTCRRHADVEEPQTKQIVYCPKCHAALFEQLQKARWLVVNYELLVQQHVDIGGGVTFAREDLAGWVETLKRLQIDVAVCDEAQMLRGWTTSRKREGEARNERMLELVGHIGDRIRIPRVWMVTGTPFYGFTRDIFWLLEIASGGLWGGDTRLRGRKFMQRYCLPGEAPVWMADMTHKHIRDVQVGDRVWGWDWPSEKNQRRQFRPVCVLETFTRMAPVVEVILASGRTVRGTEDHLWANGRSRNERERYVPARVAGSEHDHLGYITNHWYQSVLARVTDVFPCGSTDPVAYKRGYLHGLIDGDGTISFGWHLRPSGVCPSAEIRRTVVLRLKDIEAIDRAQIFALALNVPVTRPNTHNEVHTLHFQGKKALRFFYELRQGDNDYWRGFLAGVYDAEGWSCTFAQYRQVNPGTYDNIVDALTRFDFVCRQDEEAVQLLGGRDEFSRFWSLVRPAIQRKALSGFRTTREQKTTKGMSNWDKDPVVAVRPVGIQQVHCLKTETGNFVAYGYATKNCEGHKGTHGYVAKGRSVFAETELMRRLNGTMNGDKRNFDGVMIQRTREELGFTAPMQRRVVRLEIDDVQSFVPGRSKRGVDVISKLIMQTSALKLDALMDSFMNELAEGNKIIIFTFHVASAKRAYLAIEKEMKSGVHRTRMRETNAKCWLATGANRKKRKADADADADADELVVDELELNAEQKSNWASDGDARYKLAQVFRDHVGAGVIVATIDSMPGALSLRGASAVHFLDLHWSPGAIAQAENRPWYPEVKDLSVIYYAARGSVDDHIVAEVLPKAETLARMGRERGAEAMLDAFRQPDETRTVEAIWDRLMRHLHGSTAVGLDGGTEVGG
ncbi:radical SAM protein-like protein [Virus Rctr197k]|nr:radical SAM protein-like protein [Virus Rctr197k]